MSLREQAERGGALPSYRQIGLFALSALLLVGCEQIAVDDGQAGTSVAEQNLPPAEVRLPPVPPLEALDVPRRYDDQSHSVAGLFLDRTELRGDFVRVRAVVQEIYACADADAAGADGAETGAAVDGAVPTSEGPCLHPHLYVADTIRSPRRLLVVGYDADHYEEQLRVGSQYTIAGRYAQRAQGFISTEEGLLIAEEFSGEGVAAPGTEEALTP